MEKIAFLEANQYIVERTEALFQQQIESGQVVVHRVGIHTIEAEVWELLDTGVCAVIARGGTYQDVRAMNIRVPLIHLQISPSDILLALNRAASDHDQVDLVLHNSVVFHPEEYRELIKLQVNRYQYRNPAELEQIIDRLEDNKRSVVVGSGAISELSKRKNLNYINVVVQDTTLLQVFEQTRMLLDKMRVEVQQLNLLESVLYHISEGVFLIDRDGVITHANRKSSEMLGIPIKEVREKKLQKLFPEFQPEEYLDMEAGDKKQQLVKIRGNDITLTIAPFLLDRSDYQLIITMQEVTKLQMEEQQVRRMLVKKGLVADYTFDDIKTQDEGMKAVIEAAKRISQFDGAVLIYGESGTGKELFAQSIHNASRRRTGPFVAVNCAAISESLLESELFGYVGGAFTGAKKEGKAGMFELAHNGTVFLDEINSTTPGLQSKILRVIEQKEVMRVGSDYVIPLNVRVIAACNKSLPDRVRAGEFRQDLYFRLNTFELEIPPLGERGDDILYLFRCFLAGYDGISEGGIRIAPDFAERLKTHVWWGNIRELRSTALRYHVFQGDNRNGQILKDNDSVPPELVAKDLKIDLKELDKTVEGLVIQSLIERGMTKTETAAALGISRQALFKKLNKK